MENNPTPDLADKIAVRILEEYDIGISSRFMDERANSFGRFVHVNGRRHVVRNFKTGETIEISGRRSVIFRPAKELRQVRSFSK